MDFINRVNDVLNRVDRHGIDSKSAESLRLICNEDEFGEITGIPQERQKRAQELIGQIERELGASAKSKSPIRKELPKSKQPLQHDEHDGFELVEPSSDENRDRIAKLQIAVIGLEGLMKSRAQRDSAESTLTGPIRLVANTFHTVGRALNAVVNTAFGADYVNLAVQGNPERIPQEARKETLELLKKELEERVKQIK